MPLGGPRRPRGYECRRELHRVRGWALAQLGELEGARRPRRKPRGHSCATRTSASGSSDYELSRRSTHSPTCQPKGEPSDELEAEREALTGRLGLVAIPDTAARPLAVGSLAASRRSRGWRSGRAPPSQDRDLAFTQPSHGGGFLRVKVQQRVPSEAVALDQPRSRSREAGTRRDLRSPGRWAQRSTTSAWSVSQTASLKFPVSFPSSPSSLPVHGPPPPWAIESLSHGMVVRSRPLPSSGRRRAAQPDADRHIRLPVVRSVLALEQLVRNSVRDERVAGERPLDRQDHGGRGSCR